MDARVARKAVHREHVERKVFYSTLSAKTVENEAVVRVLVPKGTNIPQLTDIRKAVKPLGIYILYDLY
jgi:hypothetical protein